MKQRVEEQEKQVDTLQFNFLRYVQFYFYCQSYDEISHIPDNFLTIWKTVHEKDS